MYYPDESKSDDPECSSNKNVEKGGTFFVVAFTVERLALPTAIRDDVSNKLSITVFGFHGKFPEVLLALPLAKYSNSINVFFNNILY